MNQVAIFYLVAHLLLVLCCHVNIWWTYAEADKNNCFLSGEEGTNLWICFRGQGLAFNLVVLSGMSSHSHSSSDSKRGWSLSTGNRFGIPRHLSSGEQFGVTLHQSAVFIERTGVHRLTFDLTLLELKHFIMDQGSRRGFILLDDRFPVAIASFFLLINKSVWFFLWLLVLWLLPAKITVAASKHPGELQKAFKESTNGSSVALPSKKAPVYGLTPSQLIRRRKSPLPKQTRRQSWASDRRFWYMWHIFFANNWHEEPYERHVISLT